MNMTTKTKVRTTSASVSDQLSERVIELIRSDKPDRVELAAMLAEAIVADDSRRQQIEREAGEAERAVEDHEYSKLLARRQDARARANGVSLSPTPLSDRIRRRLASLLSDDDAAAIEQWTSDLRDEQAKLRAADVSNRPRRREAVLARMAAIGEAMRALPELRYAVDVPKAISELRTKLGVKEPARMPARAKPQITYLDSPVTPEGW
jgi:hypothetical protein